MLAVISALENFDANLNPNIFLTAHITQIFQRRGENIGEATIKKFIRNQVINLRSTLTRKSKRHAVKV